MKTKTIITEITHDDLVDLLSTALYGNYILGADYDTRDYYECPDKKDDDCYEDKMARILLNGGCITVIDNEACDEDDFNGELPHHWDNEDKAMCYSVTLNDIKKGLQNALDSLGWEARCAMHLIDGEGDLDLVEADALLQMILFGEVIYG